jgi:hypothetical protein
MENTCSVKNCLGKYYAKGHCEKHYQRIKKYGTPEDKKGDHVPLEKKFWANVDKHGESVTPVGTSCWKWTGKTYKGYGRVWIDGRTERVHRASWIMENGPIPDGLCVLHRCDTPSCVRVSHLFLGTNEENSKDRSRKGRSYSGDHKGEKCWTAKLTAADVLAIRADTRMQKDIAKAYGLDPSTVSDIRRRKSWTHI